MSAAAILTISRNGETIKSCAIEGEAMLGRADGCVIRLEDRAISRQHAIFRVVGDGVQVEKKSEFAPLMVNGAEIGTSVTIKEADVISIGPYLMRVTISRPELKTERTQEKVPSLVSTLAPVIPITTEIAAEEPGQGLSLDGPVTEQAPHALGIASADPSDLQPEHGSEGMDLQGAVDAARSDVDPFGNPQSGPALASPPEEPLEMADDDARTKLTPAAKLSVHLVFQPNGANVTDFEVVKDEVSIGRGKDCDIVLNDKKASRKNAIIRRAGLSFTIKDLDSANGTYVNGARIKEQELFSDDLIRIGAVEFQFKAHSADYAAREHDFMAVPAEIPGEHDSGIPDHMQMMDPGQLQAGGLDLSQDAGPGVATAGTLPGMNAANAAGAAIPGITGIGPADIKRMSLIEKLRNFKQLPRKQQIIYGGLVLALVYFIAFDNDEPAKVAPKKKASVQVAPVAKGPAAQFAALSPEKQRFVEAEYHLAFDYFKNKEYDKSLFELGKIFELVEDYKDSKEIERYAKEGKRKLEAFEEEKRKKEEEVRLKAKIQSLVDECKERMDHKDYPQARELFTQITVLDPDNAQIASWKKEIEDWEEKNRMDAQNKQVQLEINKHAWEVYGEAMGLKKHGKYHSAIEVFGKVGDIGASDKKIVGMAAKQIKACYGAIRAARDPLLTEANTLEKSGELVKAFALYKKATRVDPPHPAGYAGMSRIRGVLHDRAKLIYTEAVLAESYSDFVTAKKKFSECKEMAPVDDIYFERASRKLARYFRKEDQQP